MQFHRPFTSDLNEVGEGTAGIDTDRSHQSLAVIGRTALAHPGGFGSCLWAASQLLQFELGLVAQAFFRPRSSRPMTSSICCSVMMSGGAMTMVRLPGVARMISPSS